MARLSKNQLKSLKMTGEGLSAVEQGVKLGSDMRAAQNLMYQVKKKLKARNSCHAVTIGFRMGLLNLYEN